MIYSKGLAIIQDSTARLAIQIEQMVNIWKFDTYSKSWESIPHYNCFIINNISKYFIYVKLLENYEICNPKIGEARIRLLL